MIFGFQLVDGFDLSYTVTFRDGKWLSQGGVSQSES